MAIELKPEERGFLSLACKVASGHATAEEKKQLDGLLAERPELKQRLKDIERHFTVDQENELMEEFIRVLVGTASGPESAKVMELRTTAPKKWQQFVRFRAALERLIDPPLASDVEAAVNAPMPERVRERLLRELEQKRAGMQSKGK
jgi:hypothetical protein